MARISFDVDDEWLADAREELGTDSAEATINAALRELVRRKRAERLIEVLNSVGHGLQRVGRRLAVRRRPGSEPLGGRGRRRATRGVMPV